MEPTAGGKIGGKGQIEIALGSQNSRSGLVFDLQAENLPADAIAQIYNIPLLKSAMSRLKLKFSGL